MAERLDLFHGETQRLAGYAFDVQLKQPIWDRWMGRQRHVEDLGVTLKTLLHLDFTLEEVGQALGKQGDAALLLRAWKHGASA